MGDRASADSLRWNLDLALDQPGADLADVPGGASELLCRDYRGKEADRLVTRIDPGVVLLVAELRAATSGRRPRSWASGRRTTRIARRSTPRPEMSLAVP